MLKSQGDMSSLKYNKEQSNTSFNQDYTKLIALCHDLDHLDHVYHSTSANHSVIYLIHLWLF